MNPGVPEREPDPAWLRVQLARHPKRPHSLDYIERLFTDFQELHGDRSFSDDPAIVAGMALFGWLFYVRLPKMPTEISFTDDGWVNFQSRRGTTQVQAADIRSIARTFGRRTLRVEHAGGQVRVPNRFKRLLDILLTLKGLNPAIEIRGF